MNVQRLLNTNLGRIFISILLGLGLATLFRKACKDKDCIVFNGPIISDLEGKTYQYQDKCYQYSTEASKCDSTKKIIDVSKPDDITAAASQNMVATTPTSNVNSMYSIFK